MGSNGSIEHDNNKYESKIESEETNPFRVFVSGQMTTIAAEQLTNIGVPYTAEIIISDPTTGNIRFNGPKTNDDVKAWSLFTNKSSVDVPVYDYMVQDIAYNTLINTALYCQSKSMGLKLPRYGLDDFVLDKTKKIKVLSKLLRSRGDTINAAKMDFVIICIEDLDRSSIKSMNDWNNFIINSCCLPVDWQYRLHFNDCLQLIGVTDDDAKEIQTTQYNDKGNITTYGQYAMRWWSKIIGGYKVIGCMTDFINLIFAIMIKDPTGMDPKQVFDVIEEFVIQLKNKDFTNMWIPNYILHDSELDDMEVWVTIQYICNELGIKLIVLAQMPDIRIDNSLRDTVMNINDQHKQSIRYAEIDADIKTVNNFYKFNDLIKKLGATVFIDTTSVNKNAIIKGNGLFVRPKRIKRIVV
jgi:hypothetical protein